MPIWHSTNTCRRWRDRAIPMHRPSDTFDTCWLRNWHRHWLVVWSRPGSTTAMLCSTALPATASRSCSEYRTTQLGSFSRLQDDPTPARCWGRYTAWLQSGPADVQGPQHIDVVVPPSPNPGLTTQPQHEIGHYDAVLTFHNDDFCEARLPMLCSGCLELTTENCR